MTIDSTVKVLTGEEAIDALKGMCDKRVRVYANPFMVDCIITHAPSEGEYDDALFCISGGEGHGVLFEHEVEGGYWQDVLDHGDWELTIRTYRNEFDVYLVEDDDKPEEK